MTRSIAYCLSVTALCSGLLARAARAHVPQAAEGVVAAAAPEASVFPDTPGVSPDACLADADGDGLVGADHKCPDQPETKNGFEDSDGCRDELPTVVKEFMGVIAGIEFDSNQAVIRPSSLFAIDQAVAVLTDYPSLRIEITGHVDDRGSRERNVELSRQRAEAVRQRLIENGIDASRIEAKGYGPDMPVTSNSTAAGRQKNRCIEFRVLQ